MELSKEKKEDVLRYSVYTILYTNDLALNCIKDLKTYIQGKDKQTIKIYGALMKRVNLYFKNLRSVAGQLDWFLADYDSVIDEEVDKSLCSYKKSIQRILKLNNINNAEYLSALETARSMTELAISSFDEIISQMNLYKIPPCLLPKYKVDEIYKITNNLVEWVSLTEKPKKCIDLSTKKSVMRYLTKIRTSIASVENHDRAMANALHEENVRKRNNGGNSVK